MPYCDVDSLSIGHLNINSLPNKVLDLNVFLANTCKCHMFGITESRLHSVIKDETLMIPNYSIIRKDAVHHGHTGLAVYVHDLIKHVTIRRTDLESDVIENLWFELKASKCSILIGFIYRNPKSDPKWYDDFVAMMDVVENVEHGKDVILLGDFNVNVLKNNASWDSTISLFNLHQMVQTPTRVTQSTESLIDHIYTNNPERIIHCNVHQTSMSDHFTVQCALCNKIPKAQHKPQSIITYRSFKHFNSVYFLNDLDDCSFDEIYSTDNPDIAFTSFIKLFCTIFNRHAPIKKKRVKNTPVPPWFDSNIKAAISIRDKLKKNREYTAFKQQRKHVKFLIRQAKKKYFNSVVKSNTNNVSSIWRAINSLNNKSFRKQPSTTNSFSPDDFNDHFLSIADNLTDSINQNPEQYVCSDKLKSFCSSKLKKHDTFDIPEISVHEVGKHITCLGNKSTEGYDGISNKILLLSLPYIVQHLTYLYNLCIKNNYFPSVLKIAKVTPLPKVKNPSNLNDYRPISILSALSKPIEKHIHNHLLQYFDNHGLLHPLQSGFRPKHSCQTALTHFIDQLLSSINKKDVNGVVFLDLKKAFDLVNHHILLKKLRIYQVSPNTIHFFNSYLANRKQAVLLNNCLSYEGTITTGIPQGSVLGPLLFNIFINDLPLSISSPDIMCDQFADDCTLLTAETSLDHINSKLQASLSEVTAWCYDNNMVLNPEKTKCMVVTTRQKHQLENLKLNLIVNNHSIEQVTEHRHLGVTIDENLNWDKHINALSKSAARNVYLLSRLSYVTNRDACFFFFHAHVMSLINYASNLWDGCNNTHFTKLNSVHKRALKILCKVSSGFENEYNLSRPLSLNNHLKYNKCILMHKIMHGKCPSYLDKTITSTQRSSLNSRNMTLILPKPRIDLFKTSLVYSGTSCWNGLPQHLKQPSSTETFKNKLLMYLRLYEST